MACNRKCHRAEKVLAEYHSIWRATENVIQCKSIILGAHALWCINELTQHIVPKKWRVGICAKAQPLIALPFCSMKCSSESLHRQPYSYCNRNDSGLPFCSVLFFCCGGATTAAIENLVHGSCANCHSSLGVASDSTSKWPSESILARTPSFPPLLMPLRGCRHRHRVHALVQWNQLCRADRPWFK